LENIALEDICSKFKSVLFISAFDMVHDPVAALETLLTLGFERVLTSGCDSSALEGLPLIKRLIDQVQAISFLSSSDCGYS
jgi:copper homeostasis protein CutC